MIGVIANPAEHSAVREFFELFKTPWEFFRTGGTYEVVICSDASRLDSSAKLILIYGGREYPLDAERGVSGHAPIPKAVILFKGSRLPLYGDCVKFETDGLPLLSEEHTQAAVTVSITSHGRTTVRIGYDLFREIGHLLSFGQPGIHAAIPALELHIEFLRDVMVQNSIRFVEIPPVPEGFRFITCLTHDVDHPAIRNHKLDHTFFGFLHRATFGSVLSVCRRRITLGQLWKNWIAVLKLPFVHLGIARDFWAQTERYLHLERNFGSTFFIVPDKNYSGRQVQKRHSGRRATRYQASDIADDLRKINAAGGEIGLHGIDAWLDGDSGRRECQRVSLAAGTMAHGVRMHWLCFDRRSPAALDEAGFSYDSSVGYNECAGYRAGTLQVYRPDGAEHLLELPLHIMDTALFYPAGMNLSAADAAVVVDAFLKDAGKFGGVITFNWHDRSLAPERLWDRFYIQLLERLQNGQTWCPTAGRAVAWFRKRRSATIMGVQFNGASVRLQATLTKDTDDLPGLMIRIHNPPGPPRASGHGYADFPFNGDLDEITIQPN